MKKKAFTLIELIAVLVILAILALIVTPLVMNIIRKTRISADKRSIDAYGRSIELAIATYLLDEGKFPTSIDELTIEYSGDRVVCETSQLNSDSSVYLARCTVAGRNVDYTYGKEENVKYSAYNIGDEVTYNNVDYYVIADSSDNEASLTLLKKYPLTTAEVNQYGGVGTANNHVNVYFGDITQIDYYQQVLDVGDYGSMAYYVSESCGYVNGSWVESGCTTDYAQSEVKYVVDAWKVAQAPQATSSRLITYEELSELGEIQYNETPSGTYEYIQLQYDWLYNTSWYWTMTTHEDSAINVWRVSTYGKSNTSSISGVYSHNAVRPVIVLNKKFIED